MCLTIRGFKTRKEAREFKPLIAKEDIKVYKNLRHNGYSPYQTFKYEKGFHYSVEKFGKTVDWSYDHPSYPSVKNWYLQIDKGLHSYTSLAKAKESFDCKTVVMYVPKGAKYYINDNREIVSNNLIWY